MPLARNRPRRDQPAAAGGQSDFLQFLERLNEDIFCETLLPMLIQDASAGNLAATCSQLRKLCHSSVKGLKLRPLLCSDEQPSIAGDWTHNLQEHFPHCRAVAMQVHDKESYHAVNYVLPALARLPDLVGIGVQVKGPPLLEMLPMAMLLLSLCTQLTNLQSLTMTLSQSWAGARLAWAELAAMTQLTKLSITSANKDGGLCCRADLLQLSRLCGLREFCIDVECRNPAQQPVSFELVSQMSGLTNLTLGACSTDGFSSLGNCRQLGSLVLPDFADVGLELSAADWGVVGKLSQLTFLRLWSVTVNHVDCEVCSSALQQLTALQDLAAEAWSLGVLTGLQGLSHLTSLQGGWLSSGDPIKACPQLQELALSYGHIPCSAFPNLLHVSLCQLIPSSVLVAMSRHCRKLQSLKSADLPKAPKLMSGTLPATEPVAVRAAAVRSLTDLHHLTALDFCVSDNAEMLALAQMAAALARHKLLEMRVVVHSTSEVSSMGLSSLAMVSGIQALYVWLLKSTLMDDADTAQVFAAVLASVNRLQLAVATEEQYAQLDSAFEHVRSCGLQLPHEHVVAIVE